MSTSSICPCDVFVEPSSTANPSGRSHISYRIGDYLTFRHALLLSRAGETELPNWRPSAQGDLALQMMEWWAYLADILTFYNERIANQDYLRTADLPESVQRLVFVLGYRPRPGIGASGTLAALMNAPKPFLLKRGFQVQSKPGPGQQPQIFELNADTLVQQPDVVPADPIPNSVLIDASNSLLVKGTIGSVKKGDELLLLERNWSGQDFNFGIATVQELLPEKDPRGNKNTRIRFNESLRYLSNAQVQDYRLLKSTQPAHVWQYPANQVIFNDHIDLDAIARGIKVGDPVLLDIPDGTSQGIYFSPDGKNLGGGGNTINLGAQNRTVINLLAFQSGVLTAFDRGGIYFSPDGQNLEGGGNTTQVYAGTQIPMIWATYQNGVIAAFGDGNIYYSPDGSNLGGGGQTLLVGNSFFVNTILSFQGSVIASFGDGTIHQSPDGANLTGGGETQLLFSGPQVLTMIPFQAEILTSFDDNTIFLSPDGQNLHGGGSTVQVYSGASNARSMITFQGGVITAFTDGTAFLSPDGTNLGGGGSSQQVYSGGGRIIWMIPYQSGVITAFGDRTIFYSPDGTNLGGGGQTVLVYGPGRLAIAVLPYGGGVLASFAAAGLVSVTGYAEKIWYANPKDYPKNPNPDPSVAPDPPAIPIPIPHTEIAFVEPGLMPVSDSPFERATLAVRYAFQEVGQLIPTPATTFTGAPPDLIAVPPASFPADTSLPLLIEDASGTGEAANGFVASDTSTVQLSNLPSPAPILTAPLNAFLDLLSVSRGKSVVNEVLGNGDAMIAGQEFVLQKSPLTYLLSGDTSSGGSYKSTLRVWVDGVEWREVPSFYGQPAHARVFVTREDESNVTHVLFGDAINAARLPSGVNNVIATYRYGSGSQSPDAGSLSVILQPQPGLKAIRNPVPVGGGADPDPPAKIRRYAPQSVLTFGRAVSGNDYEVIAAQAPGVARAKAYWSWDPLQQRTVVTVYVGDDANAVNAAQVALGGADDPNRPVVVKQATALSAFLSFTLLVRPDHVLDSVVNGVTAALLDPDNGLFGANVIRIGQLIYESQIYEACLSVARTIAVHGLRFTTNAGFHFFRPFFGLKFFPLLKLFPHKLPAFPFFPLPFHIAPPFRFDPGQGGFFQLGSANLTFSTEVAANAR